MDESFVQIFERSGTIVITGLWSQGAQRLVVDITEHLFMDDATSSLDTHRPTCVNKYARRRDAAKHLERCLLSTHQASVDRYTHCELAYCLGHVLRLFTYKSY